MVRRVRAALVLTGVAIGASVGFAFLYILIHKAIVPTPPGRQFPWEYLVVMFAIMAAVVSALLWALGVAILSRFPRFSLGPVTASVAGAIAASIGSVLVVVVIEGGWHHRFERMLPMLKFTAPIGAMIGLGMERVARLAQPNPSRPGRQVLP